MKRAYVIRWFRLWLTNRPTTVRHSSNRFTTTVLPVTWSCVLFSLYLWYGPKPKNRSPPAIYSSLYLYVVTWYVERERVVYTSMCFWYALIFVHYCVSLSLPTSFSLFFLSIYLAIPYLYLDLFFYFTLIPV